MGFHTLTDKAFDKLADMASADPEQELRVRLTQEAFNTSFGMMSKAWTGWDQKEQGGSGSGVDMGCFLAPMEKQIEAVINHQLRNEDIYKSVFL